MTTKNTMSFPRSMLSLLLVSCSMRFSTSALAIPDNKQVYEALDVDGTAASVDLLSPQESGLPARPCVEGHSVPSFYLLGPPKTGTTALAVQLKAQGIRYPLTLREQAHWVPWKESHFFSHAFPGEGINVSLLSWMHTDDGIDARLQWLRHFPSDCARGEDGDVQGDFSSTHFGHSGVASRIAAFHGPVLARRLTFAVVVRRPTDQLVSFFHHFCLGRSHPMITACFGFTEPLLPFLNRSLLEHGSHTCSAPRPHEVPPTLCLTQYAARLREWLQSFAPRQFLLVPHTVLKDEDGMRSATHLVWGRLAATDEPDGTMHYSHKGNEAAPPPLIQNSRASHLSMVEAVNLITDPVKRIQLRAASEAHDQAEATSLAYLLSQKLPEGLMVAGLPDEECLPGDALAAWLVGVW